MDATFTERKGLLLAAVGDEAGVSKKKKKKVYLLGSNSLHIPVRGWACPRNFDVSFLLNFLSVLTICQLFGISNMLY